MKYRLAAFDFDGTLADSGDWFLQVFNELADKFGFRRIEPSDQELIRGYSAAEIMKYLRVPHWRLPAIMIYTRRRAASDWQHIRLFHGVEEMLRDLRNAGIQVAIVSSNAEQTIRNVLGPANSSLVGYFSCGASLFGKAAKLRSMLRKAKLPANSSIYIGDEIRDAVAAREVGMPFGAVSWGYTTAEALLREAPDLNFTSVSDISRDLIAVSPD